MKIDDYRNALDAKRQLSAPSKPAVWANSEGYGIVVKPEGFRCYNADTIIERSAKSAFAEVEEAFRAAFSKHFEINLAELRRAAIDEFSKMMGGA